MPSSDYKCVCGHTFKHYGNLRSHRLKCESYREHVSKMDHAYGQMKPTEDAEPQTLYGCPYCRSEYETTTFGNLEAHIISCRTKHDVDPEEGERRAMLRQIRAWLAWDVWQREEESG